MSNTMNVGSVRLFDTLCRDKSQAMQVLEGINFETRPSDYYKAYAQMVDECADVVQTRPMCGAEVLDEDGAN